MSATPRPPSVDTLARAMAPAGLPHALCVELARAAGVPVLLWGGPGVGKTSVVEQIARHHGWHLETVIASICDPTDFKGMPRDAGDRTVFSPPNE